MATFQDNNGREWNVSLDYLKILEVRAKWCTTERCSHMTGIHDCNGLDLGNANGTGYVRLVKDPLLLLGVMWILCRDEAKKEKVTEQQFHALLKGDGLSAVYPAIVEELSDFFPLPLRGAFQAAVKVTDAEQRLQMQAMEESAPQVIEEIEKKLTETKAKALTQFRNASSSPVTAESAHAA